MPFVRLPTLLPLILASVPVFAQPPAPTPAEVTRLRALSELDPRIQRDGEPWSMDPSSREQARQFFRAVYFASEGVPTGWTGNTSSGDPGTTSAAFKEAVRNRINFYRAYAGVPASVSINAAFSAKAQQAALMFSANNSISHFPPTSWTFYTADAAEAAGKSNIGIGSFGSETMDGYMRDHGAGNAVVGHRRWILYPQTKEMGTGDVEAQNDFAPAQALWIQDANIFASRPTTRDALVAWPPKGNVPYQLVWPRWSVSLANADFSGASVTMTRNGTPIATAIEAREGGGGAPEPTLVWLYDNTDGNDLSSHVRPSADVDYDVTDSNVMVNGSSQTYSYRVTVFDPDVAGSDFVATTLSGTDTPGTGGPSSYTVAVPSFASGFVWRVLRPEGSPTTFGAEGGLQGVTASVSSDYTPRVTSPTASGGGAYHLVHPQSADQVLTLPEDYLIVPGQTASLTFKSRLGWATTGQTAQVEISTSEGIAWSVISSQSGTDGAGESSYQTKSIDLNGYAGQTIRLRFSYVHTDGTAYFNQTDQSLGWLIDDIVVSGGQPYTIESQSSHTTGSSFDYTAPNTGRLALQARGMWFGSYAMDWGPVFLAEADTGSGSSGGGSGGGSTDTSRIINLSVRANAGAGVNALTVGMVVGGSGTKPLLVRAIGPTLASFGVPGTAPDPAVEVVRDGTVIAANDNWSSSLTSTFASLGAFALVENSADAALTLELPAAPHSAVVDTQGNNGIVLVEAYDREDPTNGGARLINVSARNQVGTGANVLVAGFVIGGSGNKTLLIRGVGASLADFGVPGALANPQLVVAQNGTGTVMASNDDWNGDTNIAAVSQTLGAFALSSDADAALIVTLAPGAYTATVSGVNDTTGIGLVEIYEVP